MQTIKLSFLSMFLLILATSASAEEAPVEMVAYTWSNYDLKFEIPDYMEVKSNTSTLFYASGRDMTLNIYAEKSSARGATLADEHYAELRLSNKELVSDPSSYENEGLSGQYMIGKGNNGSQVYAFIVAGFNDDAHENAFKIDIQILTSSPDYQTIIEHAVDMLNSFGTISGSKGSSTPTTTKTSSGGSIQWYDDNFKFYIPAGLTVASNEDGYYKAYDENLSVTIKKEKTRGSVNRLAQDVFSDLRVKDFEHTADGELDMGGLEGWKLIGSGKLDDVSVVYAVLAFEDDGNRNKYSAELILYMRTGIDTDNYVSMMKDIIQGFGKIKQ